eukprot:15031031-Alexandrium_andersonii.AAC.1
MSLGCVGQADIHIFHNTVDVLKCARWLQQRGLPRELCAALVRLHTVPRVQVTAGSMVVQIGHRGRGCLTGTRSAGALGRIPPLDVISREHRKWQEH